MLSCVLALSCGLLVILIDQLSKHLVSSDLVLGKTYEFLDGIINIVFVENNGAAWGIFGGKTIVLLCFTILAMVICAVVMFKSASKSKLLFWSLSLVLSGGIGNLIDRVFRNGVVVDFLQFDFWESFPVFNIADCAIVTGGALMIFYLVLDIVKDSKKKIKQDNNEGN